MLFYIIAIVIGIMCASTGVRFKKQDLTDVERARYFNELRERGDRK